jgi:hypothetical protein
MCYKYTKSLAAYTRLIVKTLNYIELRGQLETLYNYYRVLEVLKTRTNTFK